MNTEDKFVLQGIQAGATANEAIANAITLKAQQMLTDSLESNFDLMLQAKLSQMVAETIALHADKTKQFAAKFLSQSQTRMAQGMIEAQHQYNISPMGELDLTAITGFDTDMNAAVQRLADESGTITFSCDPISSIGF